MSDQELIELELLQAEMDGRPIDDLTARIIASCWHGGQWTALYALSSTGSLDLYSDDREENSHVEDELEAEIADAQTGGQLTELRALLAYCVARRAEGRIGRQDGWSELHW